MIKISDMKFPVDYTEKDIQQRIAKELRIEKEKIKRFSIARRSVDARKKNDVKFIISVNAQIEGDEKKVISRAKSKNVTTAKPFTYKIEKCREMKNPPVIVGFGPAGLFAGLFLARAGANPIILERGEDVDSRTKAVENFWNNREFSPLSNVQFGEGGAGTFSDGKLNTGTKDIRSRIVLEEFVAHGAPDEILYNAKPHIGTDKLKSTVKNIREEIISLGGKVYFSTKLTDINIKNGAVTGAVAEQNGKKLIFDTENLILAIGHSARDTFEMLYNKGIFMEQKPFSVGARIEHLQKNTDKAQYGEFAGKGHLGAADYKLSEHLENGRGVYTFCMCPGGMVVGASSEENTVVTNGMSEFARDRTNSNAALLVGVNPSDFGSDNPLAGVEYQRKLEKAAFLLGSENYNAPAQRVEDFLQNRKTAAFGEVIPSYLPGVEPSNLREILPGYVSESMAQAIIKMDRKLHGFANGDAVLTGVETRSSSPVRISRNAEYQSVTLSGLYPCGEGAGYAGGIVSAAVDGIKLASYISDVSVCGD